MSPNAPDFSGGQTSSQFQGGIQPQFPRCGMQPATKSGLAGGLAAHTPGDHPPPKTDFGRKPGSDTRRDDMSLDLGRNLAASMLARDGRCGVFGGGFEFVGAAGLDLVAQRRSLAIGDRG